MPLPPAQKLSRRILLALAVIYLCCPQASAQTLSLTFDPQPPERVISGEDLTVTIKITAAGGATLPSVKDIKWDGIEGFLTPKGSVPEDGAPQDGVYKFTFATAKISDALEVKAKISGEEKGKFTVAIVPQITKDNLTFEPTTLPSTKLTLKQEKTEKVRLTLKGGAAIPRGAITASSDAKNFADVLVSDSTITVTGNAPGPAKVTILAYGKEVTSFDVEVTEVAEEIRASDTMTFTKGDQAKPLSSLGIELEGKEGTLWKGADAAGRLNFFSNRTDVVRVSSDEKNLEIVGVGDAQLRISAKEDSSLSRIVTVRVAPKATQIKLGRGTLTVLAREAATTINARVEDEAERLVPGVAVKFECEGANCGDYVHVSPQPNNSADIRGLKKTTAPIKIVAKVEGNANVSEASLLVDVIGPDQITDFRPLLIRLDMIDEQTAKDLFGRKAADEFYIAKVQLFNNLKKTDTEYFGDSILVYSESLQVRVALQVKCRSEDVSPAKGDTAINQCTREGEWVPVTVDMVKTHFDDEFSLDPPISGTEPIPDPENDKPRLKPCHIKAPKGFVGLYRPYSFDTVAVTHDRRDERSLRSRILTTLNGAISFTSFITAIAVPGPGSDLPLGLDKSNNLLIPSFEKLFPSMKEVQRQNILTMVMRNLEEIPFGGSVERKIFFPKGALEGLWPGHRVRIAGVSTFDACAEAAIIKKVGQQ